MLDLRIIADGNTLPLFDLPAALGRDRAMREVGDQIEALIAFMDDLAGDPDLEDSEAGETGINETGRSLSCHTLADEESNDSPDNGDRAWQEWSARSPAARRRSHEPVGTVRGTEGDEDDGDAADGNYAEDEWAAHIANGAGCAISDPGGEDAPSHVDMRLIADPAAYEYHLGRIRRTRCDRIVSRHLFRGQEIVEYRLKANDA